MKQKFTDTAFVFNKHGVRANGLSTNTDFMLKDTAFVLIHQFNKHGVRTPSIYTKGLSSLFLSISNLEMKTKATDIQTLKRTGGIQHEVI